jgi:surface protein
MFRGCTSITSLDLSGWQNIDEIVYNQGFQYMFYQMTNLTLLNVSNWTLGGATNHNLQYFAQGIGTATTGCAFTANNFDLTNCAGTLNFLRSSKVSSVSMQNWTLRPFASGGVSLNGMFYALTSNLASGDIDVDLSTWTNTEGIKNLSNFMRGCKAIGELNTTGWDTTNVTTFSYFSNLNYQLTKIEGLSGWDSTSATTCVNMFNYNYKLSFPTASSNFGASWGSNLGSCTNFTFMFNRCGFNSGGAALGAAPNIANWDISAATSVTSMFQQAVFTTALTPTNWDFSSFSGSFSGFFYGAKGFGGGTLDLSTWTIPNTVTNMTNFARGIDATTLIFGTNCNFSGVTTMQYFAYVSSLTTLTFPATVSFAACTSWVNAFTSVTLDPTSYDAILVRNDATNANTPVTLTGGSSKYTKAPSAAATARAALVTLGWSITDGGPTP